MTLRTLRHAAIAGTLAGMVGCGSTGPVGDARDPSLTPLRDRVRFSPSVTHPYLPLSSIAVATLESRGHRIVLEVHGAPKKIGPVECLVLAEKDYDDGDLEEVSYNYFAQDPAGNVYYFGEDVDEYKDGKVVGHGGAWLVGKNADEPCLFLPADLRAGLRFKRENSPPDAEEFDEIEAIDASMNVPAGDFEDVVVVKEGDRPDSWTERKYYARGVGLISENRSVNLVEVRTRAGG